MFTDINVYDLGVIVAVISGFLSGLVTWLYWRRVTPPQTSNLTRWQKYGQPALILAITNFITATSFFWILLYQNESIQTVNDWLTALMGYVGCFGCLFGCFFIVYIANIHLYGSFSLFRKNR